MRWPSNIPTARAEDRGTLLGVGHHTAPRRLGVLRRRRTADYDGECRQYCSGWKTQVPECQAEGEPQGHRLGREPGLTHWWSQTLHCDDACSGEPVEEPAGLAARQTLRSEPCNGIREPQQRLVLAASVVSERHPAVACEGVQQRLAVSLVGGPVAGLDEQVLHTGEGQPARLL